MRYKIMSMPADTMSLTVTDYIDRFVSKNPTIKTFLGPAPPEFHEKVTTLLRTISDLRSFIKTPLLEDPDLDMILAYATKHQLFPDYNSCIDAWMILSYAQQFGGGIQPTPAFHKDRELSIDKDLWFTMPDFKDFATDYVEHFIHGLSDSPIKLSKPQRQKLIKALNDLPPEQTFFLRLPFKIQGPNYERDDYGGPLGMATFLSPSPYIVTQDNGRYLLHPSMAILSLLLSVMPGPDTLKAAPIFHRINIQTLRQMHSVHHHPMAILSTKTSKNYNRIHTKSCGSAFVAAHDIFHVFMGSLLSKGEHRFVFKYALPILDTLYPGPKHDRLKEILRWDDKLNNLIDLATHISSKTYVTLAKWFSFALKVYQNPLYVFRDSICPPDQFYIDFRVALGRQASTILADTGVDVTTLQIAEFEFFRMQIAKVVLDDFVAAILSGKPPPQPNQSFT